MKKIFVSLMLVLGMFSTTNANLDYVSDGLTETLTGSFVINTDMDSTWNPKYWANLKLGDLYFYKSDYQSFLDWEYSVDIKWNANKTFSILSINKLENIQKNDISLDSYSDMKEKYDNLSNNIKRDNQIIEEVKEDYPNSDINITRDGDDLNVTVDGEVIKWEGSEQTYETMLEKIHLLQQELDRLAIFGEVDQVIKFNKDISNLLEKIDSELE